MTMPVTSPFLVAILRRGIETCGVDTYLYDRYFLFTELVPFYLSLGDSRAQEAQRLGLRCGADDPRYVNDQAAYDHYVSLVYELRADFIEQRRAEEFVRWLNSVA